MANNYPEWWNQTITVYNKYTDSTGRIQWYRRTLHNCFWKFTDTMMNTGETSIQTDTVICRVPVNAEFREKYIWDELGESRGNYFTFGSEDIIIKGSVTDTVNEYASGQRSTDLVTKYKSRGCFIVQKCSINTGIGRGNEHYYVRGI